MYTFAYLGDHSSGSDAELLGWGLNVEHASVGSEFEDEQKGVQHVGVRIFERRKEFRIGNSDGINAVR